MRAQDILPETRKLEESGMERSWAEAVAETIAKAVEPLATKADLEAESKARRKDFETLRAEIKSESKALREEFKTENMALREEFKKESMALREEFKKENMAVREEFKTENMAVREEFKTESKALREDLKTAIYEKSDANIALLREEMKSSILSLKVWLLVILLGMWGSLSALILYTQ